MLETNIQKTKKSRQRVALYCCDQCDFRAGHPTTLNTHINSVDKGIIHKCEHCDYTAKTPSIINSHIKTQAFGDNIPVRGF